MKVVDVKICPDGSMVAAESPEVLIGGAIGGRSKVSKGENVVNVTRREVCFVSREEGLT